MSTPITRVLHVVGSSEIGGAERGLVTLLAAMPGGAFELHVACDGCGPMLEEYRRVASSVRSFHLRAATAVVVAPVIESWIKELRPDVVHTHLWTADLAAGLAARRRRVRVRVATVWGSYFRPEDVSGAAYWRRTVLSSVYRAVYRRFDHVIAVADATAADLSQRPGMKVSRDRITVIPTGVDVDTVRAASQLDVSEPLPELHRPLVICVANLFPIKGHDALLSAVALLRQTRPTVQLLLVGDGPLRTELSRRIATLGLESQATLLGSRDDVPSLVARADVVALASRSEGTPLALLEALCLGKPVVATAVGGVPDLVRDGETGRLVPPGDPAAFAEALDAVLGRPSLARELGSRGREHVERHYSAGAVATRTQALYRRLLADRLASP